MLSQINRSQMIPDTSDFEEIMPRPNFSDSTVIVENRNIKIASDNLDDEINYGAQDTMWTDLAGKRIHLYGDAFVNYTNIELKAGYIILDLDQKEAVAEAITDSLGNKIGDPIFSQGQNQFRYKKLRYNFNTNKGIVYDAITQEGQLYLHGGLTKFVSKDSDSLYIEDRIFNKNALVTSCNLEHPHFGIRTNKLKLVPDKIAVLGPARLEIAGIPTPLMLPFAFIPVLKNRTSGIIFPRNYEFSGNLGFGFRGIGYYFALSDYYDLTVTGDIYTRGSWGIRTDVKYRKRYKFSGGVNLSFSKQLLPSANSAENDIRQSFSFSLNHSQDSKAHPYRKLQGNLRFTTNDFDRVNNNDANNVLENIINSNFGLTHSLPGTPFNLSATIRHSQNTLSRKIDFTLPDIQLRMNSIYPFKKSGGGNEKWFEKINVNYNSRIANFISATDTTLFTSETLKNMRYGISQDARMSASFNVLKYFTLTPSVNYDEKWFFRSLEKTFDPSLVIDTLSVDTIEGQVIYNLDTLSYGTVEDDFVSGFTRFNDVDLSLNLNTNIFGTIQFAKGWLRGIRHTIKPSVSFTYSPSTERFLEVLDTTDTRDEFNEPLSYNPFDPSVIPFGIGSLQGKRMSINYSVTNLFEAKYWSKKDSTEKKFKIFDRISMGGSYNFALDSLRWSPVSLNGTARFFKNISNLRISAVFDPYMEENNRRVNKTVLSERKRLLRFERFSLRLSTRLTVRQIMGFFGVEPARSAGGRPGFSSSAPGSGSSQSRSSNSNEERFLDIFQNFSIEHIFDFNINQTDGENNFQVGNHSIRFRGRVPITNNWNVNVGNFSYDLKNKALVYPSIGISRDLHCWQLDFSWQPQRDTYSFFIGVKASELNFIKYNYGRNNVDGFFRPG